MCPAYCFSLFLWIKNNKMLQNRAYWLHLLLFSPLLIHIHSYVGSIVKPEYLEIIRFPRIRACLEITLPKNNNPLGSNEKTFLSCYQCFIPLILKAMNSGVLCTFKAEILMESCECRCMIPYIKSFGIKS